MTAFRVRYAVLALLFAFAFTGYVQRTSVAIAASLATAAAPAGSAGT